MGQREIEKKITASRLEFESYIVNVNGIFSFYKKNI